MPSSIYPRPLSIENTPITSTNPILSSSLVITPELLKPGGGGVLRLYFSFDFVGDGVFSITKGGSLKGNLNADQDFVIKPDGYYRFDIDVEANDILNFTFDKNITTINELRVHLVLLGA